MGRVVVYGVSNLLLFLSDGEYTDCFHDLYTYNRNLQTKLVFFKIIQSSSCLHPSSRKMKACISLLSQF